MDAPTRIVLPGFGRFHGVDDNPTSRMVPLLKDLLADVPGVEVVMCEVLEVSAQECLRFFKRVEGCQDAVFVHLGVAVGRSEICLEQCAYNNADFRCPDEQGWSPEKLPIEGAHTHIDQCRRSPLPLDAICANMQADGFEAVRTSDDAGRFLCNFIYYQSLMRGLQALFVHVTPFDVIPMDEQLELLTALIAKIRDTKVKRVTIMPKDIQLARRIRGERT
jgi:pyroglutamyl-peptidase